MLVQAGIGQLVDRPGFGTSSNGELSKLFEAIAENDVAAARRVLKKRRFDVNASGDVLSVPPIIVALCARGAGANELVNLLIAAGADVNGRGSDGVATPPLLAAANLHRADLVKQLLEAGADVDGAMRNGGTALHFAALSDDPESVIVLLAAGANPDALDHEGNTPLAVALADGSSAAAVPLLRVRPRSNPNRASALHGRQPLE
jgi:ankyrin repeat protein